MSKKIDITSTAVEKGIDMAKDFLDKLIVPAVEEVGLLLKDKVTLWKFRNQVRMLNKAKAYCEKNNVNTKAISLKLLCPLLDHAALEENEELQDKWAILLSNMVDSEQNIENHVFPYLLSQLSVNEFALLEEVVNQKKERIEKCKLELREFEDKRPAIEKEKKEKIADLEIEIKKAREEKPKSLTERRGFHELYMKKMEIERELRSLDSEKRKIEISIKEPELIPNYELEEYEISNLIRLGLIKAIYRPYAYVGSHQIRNEPHSEYLELQDLEIEIEAEDDDYTMTELGELFIEACTEKKKKTVPNNG